MTSKFIFFENTGFFYDSMTVPVIQGFNASFSSGWTGIVGANGAGKTTVLKLACGLLRPREGHIRIPVDTAYCSQRTDDMPLLFPSMINSEDPVAFRLKGKLWIEPEWASRWDSLSHGERKRAQIGVALWQQPAVLALDEPTNHIDSGARSMLISVLTGYAGIGLLVSHDRELLDTLCHHCLFLNPPDAVLRPGNYSSGRLEAIREEEHLRNRKEMAKQNAARLRREVQRRMAKALDNSRAFSKRNLDPGDRDGRGRIDLARFTGVDGRAGRLASRMRARSEGATRLAESIKVRKEYELGIWMEGEHCRRDTLFRLPAGAIPLGSVRALYHPDLIMLPMDRIAVTGANGYGKSTLLGKILTSVNLPPDRLSYLPQEIDLKSSRRILDEIRNQPPDVLGKIMTVVSRLGSRPENVLKTSEPSPGELRKLLLALGIALKPHLIIMDEPTNHLDLPSIECLEEALSDCPCGLLLVSHDERLLQRLTRTRWHIDKGSPGKESRMILRIL